MEDPGFAGLRVSWLLPPTDGFGDIHQPIAVDIAVTDPMGVSLVTLVLVGDRMEGPGLLGVIPVRFSVAKKTVDVEEVAQRGEKAAEISLPELKKVVRWQYRLSKAIGIPRLKEWLNPGGGQG